MVLSPIGVLLKRWYTANQQCHEEAEKIYADILPLLDEMSNRLREVRDQINQNPNKGNREIDKILRGQTGYRIAEYEDQPLNVILASYNKLARKIIADRFPKVLVARQFVSVLLGQTVSNTNTGADMTMFLYVNDVWTRGNTTLDDGPNRDNLLDADRTEIEERRQLVHSGRKVNQCPMFEMMLWGYSDGPKLEIYPLTLK
jgi:hypothetical protein